MWSCLVSPLGLWTTLQDHKFPSACPFTCLPAHPPARPPACLPARPTIPEPDILPVMQMCPPCLCASLVVQTRGKARCKSLRMAYGAELQQ